MEEKLVINVLNTHKEIIDKYKGGIAIHIAGFQINFEKDSTKQHMENFLRLINTIAYPLGLTAIEKCISSDLGFRKKVLVNFNSRKMEIDKRDLEGIKNLDDYMIIVKNMISIAFVEHVKLISNSELENNKAFTIELNWLDSINPVDITENPKQYYLQKYIQDAIEFSEKISKEALEVALTYINKLGENKNE